MASHGAPPGLLALTANVSSGRVSQLAMDSFLRLVVIEKDSDVRALYVRKLERSFAGCLVDELESGAAALTLLSRQPVDAVVVNQRAVDLEGVALIASIRDRHPGLPVVAIGEAPLRESTIQAGADVFVEASRWRELAASLQQVLENRRETPAH